MTCTLAYKVRIIFVDAIGQLVTGIHANVYIEVRSTCSSVWYSVLVLCCQGYPFWDFQEEGLCIICITFQIIIIYAVIDDYVVKCRIPQNKVNYSAPCMQDNLLFNCY